MPVSRVEILSSIALALVTMSLASGIPTSNASTTYQPGVHVGDWWKYNSINVTCVFYCPPELQVFQDITWLNSTVTDVTGDNVTLENGVTFTNGTVRTATLSGSVETGQGNLTYQTLYYLISGGLTQGDPIYNSPMAPRINRTLTDNILGVKRPANILEVSNSLYTLEQEWDQASGILVAVRLFSSVGISASIYLTDVIWVHTPDFTVQVSAYRGSLAIELGETVNTTVKVQSVNGFKGKVNLTATVQPEGPLLRLDPSTVEVPDYVRFRCGDFICYGSGWANSTLLVSAPQNIPIGTYTATITAANQTVSRSAQLTITVTGPDFKLTANPSVIDFPVAWGNYPVWVGVESLEGFTGQVSLSAKVNATELSTSFADNSLNLLPNWSNTTLLTLRSTTLGSYEVNITATSGSRTHVFRIHANVVPSTRGDFALGASLDHVSTHPGMSATSTITVTSVDNFSGDVSLNALEITPAAYPRPTLNDPFGPRAYLHPSVLTVTQNTLGSATLTIQTPNLPIKGDYIIEIRASGRFLYHSLNITVTVSPVMSPMTPPTPSSGTSQGQNTFPIFGLAPILFYGITGGALALFASILILIFLTRKPKSLPQDDSQSLTWRLHCVDRSI